MTPADAHDGPAARLQTYSESWQRRVALTGLAIATAILVFWVAKYRVLIGSLGEWQFARLGHYFPALTAILIFAALALPASLILWWRFRARQRRDREAAPNDAVAQHRITFTGIHRTGVRFARFFGLMAILLAGAAAVASVAYTMLPDANGIETRIDSAGTLVGEGVAKFDGGRIGRIARLDERFGLMTRRTFVAPVTFGPDDHRPVRFFTTVERQGSNFVPISSGIIVQNGLPGELDGIYRAAGVTIEETPYLMMKDGAQVRWRTTALIAHLVIEALFAGLAWALLRRQTNRLLKAAPAAGAPSDEGNGLAPLPAEGVQAT